MSQFLAVRSCSMRVLLLAGGTLLAALAFAAEEAPDTETAIEAQQEETLTEDASLPAPPEPGASEEGEILSEPAADDEAMTPSVDVEYLEHLPPHEAEDLHADNPSVQAYREIAERMHRNMLSEFSGDADIDFAKGMIVHHRGAIDMARVLLEHGDDPAVRDLAREVVEAQEAEIDFLRDWLARHGHEVE